MYVWGTLTSFTVEYVRNILEHNEQKALPNRKINLNKIWKYQIKVCLTESTHFSLRVDVDKIKNTSIRWNNIICRVSQSYQR